MESNTEHRMGAGTSLESREEGPGGSSGMPARCQALAGAWTGIVPDLKEEPVSVCVCVCVCVCVYGVRMLRAWLFLL